VNGGVFFLDEQPQEQSLQPRVRIPVNLAKVIAGRVLAKVGNSTLPPRRGLRRSPLNVPTRARRLTNVSRSSM